MSSLSSYESYRVKIGEGENKKGKYIEYERRYEVPCSCHPETCCHFDEKVWTSEKFREYKNGIKEYIK
jgi:hypothetical protein